MQFNGYNVPQRRIRDLPKVGEGRGMTNARRASLYQASGDTATNQLGPGAEPLVVGQGRPLKLKAFCPFPCKRGAKS